MLTQGEVEGKAKVQTKAERIAQGKGGRGGSGYTVNDVCTWVSDPNNKNYYGWTGQQAFDAGLIDKSNIAAIDACAKKVQDAAIKEEAIYLDEEPTITEEECVCTDPMTGEEAVFPKNADGTCPACEGYEMEQTQMQLPPQMQPKGFMGLPEDKLNLGIAMGQRYVNAPAILGKRPGVREQGAKTDYIAQAELAKGMTQGTINAIQKTAANNPGAAIAAMMAAQRGSQGDIINLASQTNAGNADRSTALNKANTQHQWNQLLLDKDAADVYNQRNATWQSNKAQDFNNYWANVGDKVAKLYGDDRILKSINASTGMKWDPIANDYVNTNNKAITPEKPAEDFATKMARFKAMGITDNSDVLKAMDLERKMNIVRNGGIAYKNGGYVYADILYPFVL